MDGRLGQHGVVLELGLAEWRGVAGDDDELGLVGAQALEGRLVAESDCEGGQLSAVVLAREYAGGGRREGREETLSPFPDLITSARRELMLSEVFFFEGAIAAVLTVTRGRVLLRVEISKS